MAALVLSLFALLLTSHAHAENGFVSSIAASPSQITEGESSVFDVLLGFDIVEYGYDQIMVQVDPASSSRVSYDPAPDSNGQYALPPEAGLRVSMTATATDNEEVDGDLQVTASLFGCYSNDGGYLDEPSFTATAADQPVLLPIPGDCEPIGDPSTATITILDNDVPALPMASIEATDPNASKIGPDPGEVTVTLDKPAPEGGVILSYTTGGTAVPGTDYQSLPGTVRIGDGESSAAIAIVPIPSASGTGDRTVEVKLSAGSGYDLGTMTTAVVNIADAVTESSLRLSIAGGDNQVVTAGQPLDPFVVKITDEEGIPVPNVTIVWSQEQEPKDGTLSPTRSITSGQGLATSTLTPGNAKDYKVKAQIESTGQSVGFSVSLLNVLASLPGLTGSERTMGNALDQACSALGGMHTRTPDQQDLYERCRDLLYASVQDAANGVRELTPGFFGIPGNVNTLFATTQFDNVLERLLKLRAGARGGSTGGLTLNIGDQSISGGTIAAVLEEVARAGGGASADEAGFERLGFFINGTAGWGDKDRSGREDGFDFDTKGITAGVDYRFLDGLVLGAALGYADTNADIDANRGELDASSWSTTVYGTYYANDHFYLEGTATYGWDNYDQSRHISYNLLDGVRKAKADFDGDQFSFLLGVGYDFLKGPGIMDVYGRLRYVSADIDSYTERGARGLDLIVNSQDARSFKSVLGIQYQRAFSTAKAVLLPQIWLEWEHELEDGDDSINGYFANDPTRTAFALATDSLDSDSFRLGLGLAAQFAEGRTAYISYEAALGLNKYTRQTVTAGLRLSF